MNMDINSEWLLRMAEKEGNGIFSVGGLVSKLRAEETTDLDRWNKIQKFTDVPEGSWDEID